MIRNTVEYFINYKAILPFADQKNYLSTIVEVITTFLFSVLSIILIRLTGNYLVVLVAEIFTKMLNGIVVAGLVNKRYPYMKGYQKIPMSSQEMKEIRSDIKNGFIGKAANGIIDTTDNIIMSKALGLVVTGRFSNYALVLYTINTVLMQVVASAQASIGNLIVTEKEEIVYSVIKKMTFLSYFILAICGCCLTLLTTPL